MQDLGLPFRLLAGRPAVDLASEHDVIAKFVEQRRSRTDGQEPTLGVKPATWNLHAQDPKRAVTWYDDEADIVWLCAVTNHDYKEIVRRSKNGTLWPTATDRADIKLYRAAQRRLPLEVAGLGDALALRESAETKPGTCQRATLTGEVDVSVVVLPLATGSLSPADYYAVVHHPRKRSRPVEDDVDDVVSALLFFDAEEAELTFPTVAPSEFGQLKPGADHVLWWQRPELNQGRGGSDRRVGGPARSRKDRPLNSRAWGLGSVTAPVGLGVHGGGPSLLVG